MASSSSDSDGTDQVISPAALIGSRLVASRVTAGHAPRIAAVHRRARIREMLAVVEDDEHRAMIDEPHDDVLLPRLPGWSGSPKARATVVGTRPELVIGARSTYHTPSPNSSAIWLAISYGETGLTRAAGARQRDKAVLRQKLAHLRHLGTAANETRELRRKPMRHSGFGHPQRRELVAKIGMAQLHHPLRARHIAQPVRAQVGQPRVRPAADRTPSRSVDARKHGLAAMGQIAQARGPIDGRADVVAFVAQPAPRRCARRCAAGSEPSGARCSSSAHATASLARAKATTKLSPSPCSTGRTPWWAATRSVTASVEARDGVCHLVGLGLPQPRRPLDVGEQQASPCRSAARSRPGRSSSTASVRG